MNKNIVNKKLIATITLILTLTFTTIVTFLPAASAQIISVPDRPTGPMLSVNPTVIGVNQPLTVNIQIYPTISGPNTEMGSYSGYGRHAIRYENATGYDGNPLYGLHYENVTATFTRPDGSKDTFMPLDGSFMAINTLPGMTEETGGLWFIYYPQQIGEWTVQYSFPGQIFTILNYTVKYLPSTSRVVKFTVQADPVRIGLDPVELPTGYWTRPISPNNREWWEIGGDWLTNTHFGNFNPYTAVPESAHILWKMAGTGVAGIAGGMAGNYAYSAGGFSGYAGGGPAINYIWGGRIYYTYTTPTDGSHIVCADQYTGETIWERPGSISLMYLVGTVATTSASIYSGSPFVELWSFGPTGWTRYDPQTGAVAQTISPATGQTCLSINNWDSSYTYGYVLQQGPLVNSRRTFSNLIGWNRNAAYPTWHDGIMFNVSMIQPDGTDPGFRSMIAGSLVDTVVLDDPGLVIVTSIGTSKLFAFDMYTGQQKWVADIGFVRMYDQMFTEDGNYIAFDSATMKYHCFDLSSTGITELWVTQEQPGQYPWAGATGGMGCMAYGNMYTCGYDGYVRCWDLATGNLKWDYFVGSTSETPMGTWSTSPGLYGQGTPTAADGKIYFSHGEHSNTQPYARGATLTCIDAYTGEFLWNIEGQFSTITTANGYVYASDTYTGMTYCFGKGQTATKVSIQDDVIAKGDSVLIKGSVMDLSPAQSGTPAISDEDMITWMNYLHMQNATLINNPPFVRGIEVSLATLDPNFNYYPIGTVTCDQNGNYGLMWEPPVPGTYQIIATFAGSESYWASEATTYLGIEDLSASGLMEPELTEPAATSAETFTTTTQETFAITTEIAIIAAVAVASVIGVAAYWMLKKRQ